MLLKGNKIYIVSIQIEITLKYKENQLTMKFYYLKKRQLFVLKEKVIDLNIIIFLFLPILLSCQTNAPLSQLGPQLFIVTAKWFCKMIGFHQFR